MNVGYSLVEQRTGAPCLSFSGALGGMMTPNVQDHYLKECQQMGVMLVEAGIRELEHLGVLPAETFEVQSVAIRERLTNPLFKLAFRRHLMPDVWDKKSRVSMQVNLVKIGPLWLATIPGDLLPKLGLSLKASLR